MAGLLPPVVATLLADTKEYTAKMDEATGKMEEFGAASDTSGGKLSGFASKASTAIIGVGVAFAAYATDEAYKFQEALDTVQNQTNVTAKELAHISDESLKLSDQTGKSATDIVQAYGAVEAAGYKRAQADATVTAANKLALISNNSVLVSAQALIAARNLGITKDMSAAKTADLLTIALKGNEGGLSGVVSLLSGKVGSAFAAYHQSAGEAVAVANEFSLAGITQTRQIATFVNKLGALQGPMETTSVINGELETSSAGYVNSLKDVGLNVDKTKQAFAGPDGLINGLKYLKTTADGSLPKLQQYLMAIFGATGVGGGMALINNLSTLTKTVKEANNASGVGLNKSASVAAGQLDNQLKIIEERLKNTAIEFGLKLLPYVQKAAHLLEDAMNFLDEHPDALKALAVTFGGLFALAVADKLATGLKSIWGVVNSRAQTGLLEDIAANTAKIAAEGGVGDAEGAGGDAALGAGAAGRGVAIGAGTAIAGAVAVGVAAGLSAAAIKRISENPNASASARNAYNQATIGQLFKGGKITAANVNTQSQTVLVDGQAVTLSGKTFRHSSDADILPKPTKKKSGTLTIKHKTLVGWTK